MESKWNLEFVNGKGQCMMAARSLTRNSRILSELPVHVVVRPLQEQPVPDAHELTLDVLSHENDALLETFMDSAGLRQFDASRIPGPWDRDRVQRIYSIMNTNQLAIKTSTYHGAAFCPALSRVNHACYDATAYLETRQRPDGQWVCILRARRDMYAGEEITLSYTLVPKSMPTLQRRIQLMDQFGFACQCEDCLRDQRATARAHRGRRLRIAVTSHANYTAGPVCRNCGVVEGLKHCSRCKAVWYCSQACQAYDWHEPLWRAPHKEECVAVPKK